MRAAADPGRAAVTCRGSVAVARAPGDALRLFTPEGERLWVPGWAPTYPVGGTPPLREGLAFHTEKEGVPATWLVTRWDPEGGRATYAYVLPERWATVVDVLAEGRDGRRCVVGVTYHMTSLAPEADEAVRAFGEGFDARLEEWGAALQALGEGDAAG